ncbi:MAG: NADH dehydrogenase FAD-containing subunit [Desulfovibrio sp.]|nr:NADH dehydrogenase FAD-containing subunit [Desulfovibrio sp.]
MIYLLICLPLAAALASWFILEDRRRRVLLTGTAGLELLLALSCLVQPPEPVAGGALALDSIGLLVLTLTCTLFFAAALYAAGYLQSEPAGERRDFVHGLHFTNAPEATFTACLLLFLSSSVLAAASRHFGLLWIGIETTTVVSAPLIYFHRHRRSLEAAWKYLLLCSVGIAMALVGNLLLDIAVQSTANETVGMTLSDLVAAAPGAHQGRLKAAYVFLLIGYGTKMGIAPMHTWLPDAHSEAPSLVSALLSGALLNCAFLGIFRATEVTAAAGLTDFSDPLLITFGILSMTTGALFIVGQGDYKRMLAYSGVEHMGILLLALGTGGEAAKGGVLHMAGHSLVKAALFLLAGNILACYRTKIMHDVTGMRRLLPATSALWTAGIIAVCGSPPFVLFASEFSILEGLLRRSPPAAVYYLFLLGVVFVGMMLPAQRMYAGAPPPGLERPERKRSFSVLTPACLIVSALLLGLYMPARLDGLLCGAAPSRPAQAAGYIRDDGAGAGPRDDIFRVRPGLPALDPNAMHTGAVDDGAQ